MSYTVFNAKPHYQSEGTPIEKTANYVAAVVRLQTKAPALHALLMHNVNVITTPHVPTAATCGFFIYINPQFFSLTLISVEERTALLAHELMHVVLRHGMRGRSYRKAGKGPDGSRWDPRTYNEAADYVINADLRWMGMDLSRVGWLLDSRFTRDDLVDSVYLQLLEDKANDPSPPPPPPPGGQPGDESEAGQPGDAGEGDAGDEGDDGDAGDEGDASDGESFGGGDGDDGDADDGEASDGDAGDAGEGDAGEGDAGDGDGDGDGTGDGESDDEGGSTGHGGVQSEDSTSISSTYSGHDVHLEPLYDGTPAEQEKQAREDEESLKGAVESAIGVADKAIERGDADYSAKPSANMKASSRSGDQASSTDWRTEVQQFLLSSGRGGETNWGRINRKRFTTLGIVAPTYKGTCSQLVITSDISASVSDTSHDKFLIECAQAIDIIKPTSPVIVLWVREYVYAVNEVTSGEELLALARPSCGGTRMSAAVEWCEDNGIIPDLHLIFTDGEMSSDDYAGVAQGDNTVFVFDRDIHQRIWINRKVQQSGVPYVRITD